MTIKRWIFFALAIIAGLGFGLYYGWVISPVQYIDTPPSTLRIDFRADYTLMVAEAFHNDQNLDMAAQRLAILGSQAPTNIAASALSFARQNNYSQPDIALLQNLTVALQVWKPESSKGATENITPENSAPGSLGATPVIQPTGNKP